MKPAARPGCCRCGFLSLRPLSSLTRPHLPRRVQLSLYSGRPGLPCAWQSVSVCRVCSRERSQFPRELLRTVPAPSVGVWKAVCSGVFRIRRAPARGDLPGGGGGVLIGESFIWGVSVREPFPCRRETWSGALPSSRTSRCLHPRCLHPPNLPCHGQTASLQVGSCLVWSSQNTRVLAASKPGD